MNTQTQTAGKTAQELINESEAYQFLIFNASESLSDLLAKQRLKESTT